MAPKKQVGGGAVKVKRNELTMEGHLLYSDVHDELFGTGWEHTVYTKAILIHVEKGLRKLWTTDDGSDYKYRISRPKEVIKPNGEASEHFEDFFRKFFKEVTGFDVTQPQKFDAQQKKNNGYLKPRDPQKGPQPKKLEEQFHELPEWMDKQVEQATHGGYLTIKRLMKRFKEDFIIQCEGPLQEGEAVVQPVMAMPGKHAFRRALHRMNFQYMKRRVKRLEARESEPVLQKLDECTQWTMENHLYGPSKYVPGKMVYSYKPEIRVGFGDESYMNSTEYRDSSWTSEKMRYKDFLKRNSRLAIVHTIFSDKNMEPIGGGWIVEPAIWCTEWKKKRENYKFWGKTNAENLEAIYGDALFALAKGAKADSKNILFLDNYSAHKRVRDELRGTAQDIIDWVNGENNNEVDEEVRNVVLALCNSAGARDMEVDRKELLKALKDKGVPILAMEVLAKNYNGMEVKYLPPYYSELNPIELLWAEVKRFYRDETSPEDDWGKRMEEAWKSITPQFVESCFDRSIRWALKKHKEREEAKAKAAAPAAAAEIGAGEEDMDEDDHEYEELLAEEAMAAMAEDMEEILGE